MSDRKYTLEVLSCDGNATRVEEFEDKIEIFLGEIENHTIVYVFVYIVIEQSIEVFATRGQDNAVDLI